MTGVKGDVNQDGTVSISDVTAQVNAILGKESRTIPLEFADMDGDGDVTVADVIAVVKVILTNE